MPTSEFHKPPTRQIKNCHGQNPHDVNKSQPVTIPDRFNDHDESTQDIHGNQAWNQRGKREPLALTLVSDGEPVAVTMPHIAEQMSIFRSWFRRSFLSRLAA
jgi:hypothetical protein